MVTTNIPCFRALQIHVNHVDMTRLDVANKSSTSSVLIMSHQHWINPPPPCLLHSCRLWVHYWAFLNIIIWPGPHVINGLVGGALYGAVITFIWAQVSNNDNGELLSSAQHKMLLLVTGPVHSCAISTPFWRIQHCTRDLIAHIAISVLPGELIYIWVKWSTWGLSALPKSTTSKQWCARVDM